MRNGQPLLKNKKRSEYPNVSKNGQDPIEVMFYIILLKIITQEIVMLISWRCSHSNTYEQLFDKKIKSSKHINLDINKFEIFKKFNEQ